MSKFKVLLVLLVVTLTGAEFSQQKNGTDFPGKSALRSKTKGFRARTPVFEDFFNVYDSTFLAFVWPKLKNGIHLSLRPLCWEHVSFFYKELLEGRSWAYNVLDASGHYQSGIFEGNHYWIGSKQECFLLNQRFSVHYDNGTWERGNKASRKEKYFDGSPEGDWHNLSQRDEKTDHMLQETTPPFSLSFNTVKFALNISKPAMAKSYSITLGLCLPTTCSPDDIHAILDFSIMITDHLRTNKTIPRSVQISSVRKIENAYDLRIDATALVLIFFTISLLIVIVVATAVDFDLIRLKPKKFRSMSFDIQKVDADTPLKVHDVHDKPNDHVEVHRRRPYEVPRAIMPKPEKDVGLETLTINNINNSNHINLVTVKKILKPDANPPSITLDVIAIDERKIESCCNRCGKYRKQCSENRHSQKLENLPACPRMKFNNSYASLNIQNKSKCKRKDFFKSVLCCFSLRYSWYRICNNNLTNRDLSIVHGLKITSILWIMLVHVTLIVFYLSENGSSPNKSNTAFTILATGTLAFDTLIFVSGILSSHHFFYLRSRYTLKELVSFGGNCGHILQFICFVTNRAVRLLPPYVYTIFLGAVLSRASNRTFPIDLPDKDHSTCDSYWWRNILYINNFYKQDDRCMQISWYLSLETQLHALGTLLLSFVPGRGGAGAVAVGVVMATVAADIITSWRDRAMNWTDPYSAYATLVDRPWARFAPYFLGVLTGWLVHKYDGKVTISKCKSTCLWTLSLTALPTVIIRPWFASSLGVLDIALSALAHCFWTAALVWPTVVLATKWTHYSRRFLDNSFVAALSRLSYGMLLLHGVFARYLLLSTETALSVDSVSLWSYYTGITMVSLFGSFLLSVLVETPCCSLLRRLSDCTNANT